MIYGKHDFGSDLRYFQDGVRYERSKFDSEVGGKSFD